MDFPPYRNLDKLTPDMRARVDAFLQEAASAGFSLLVTETWRSRERQQYLYSLGRTRPGKIVTWTLDSKHCEGLAIDVAFLQDGKLSYVGDWETLGRIGEKNGCTWGGRWPTVDRPHFEFNPDFQKEHWATAAEEKLLNAGIVTMKKNLNEPVSRGELYVILNRLHRL